MNSSGWATASRNFMSKHAAYVLCMLPSVRARTQARTQARTRPGCAARRVRKVRLLGIITLEAKERSPGAEAPQCNGCMKAMLDCGALLAMKWPGDAAAHGQSQGYLGKYIDM